MPLRTRSISSNEPNVTTIHTESNGAYSEGVWSPGFESHTMTDVNHPGYREALARGEIVFSEMNVSHELYQQTPGSLFSTNGGWWQNNTNYNMMEDYRNNWSNSPSYSVTPSTISEDAKNRCVAIAKQKALAAMDQTSGNLVEDALEFHKTLDFLKSPLDSVRDVISKAKKARPSALADMWLSSRFAYGQLIFSAMSISDVVDKYHNSLLKGMHRENFRQRAVGTENVTNSYATEITASHVSGGGTQSRATLIVNEELSCRAGIIYKVRKRDYDRSWYTGLRIKNYPRGVWNILPYTWVSDRFLDVSSMIQGSINLLDPNLMIEVAWLNMRVKSEKTTTLNSLYWPGYSMAASGSDYRLSKNLSRTQWMPMLGDTTPSLTLASLNNIKQTLDHGSLLLKRFEKALIHK